METQNHYSVLNCDENASKEELKKQFKKLALKTHPDKIQTNDCQDFHRIDAAIKVLDNDFTRRQYDSQLIEKRTENRIINEELSITDFTLDSETKTYWCDCRCGDCYYLTENDLLVSQTKTYLTVDCNSCSLSVKLKF